MKTGRLGSLQDRRGFSGKRGNFRVQRAGRNGNGVFLRTLHQLGQPRPQLLRLLVTVKVFPEQSGDFQLQRQRTLQFVARRPPPADPS